MNEMKEHLENIAQLKTMHKELDELRLKYENLLYETRICLTEMSQIQQKIDVMHEFIQIEVEYAQK